MLDVILLPQVWRPCNVKQVLFLTNAPLVTRIGHVLSSKEHFLSTNAMAVCCLQQCTSVHGHGDLKPIPACFGCETGKHPPTGPCLITRLTQIEGHSRSHLRVASKPTLVSHRDGMWAESRKHIDLNAGFV